MSEKKKVAGKSTGLQMHVVALKLPLPNRGAMLMSLVSRLLAVVVVTLLVFVAGVQVGMHHARTAPQVEATK